MVHQRLAAAVFLMLFVGLTRPSVGTAQGTPTTQDTPEIQALRERAANGDLIAQFNLGRMYADGRGVPEDYVEAHKWMNLAASRVSGADLTQYTEALDTLAKQMSPAQIADAQERARVWQPTEQKTP